MSSLPLLKYWFLTSYLMMGFHLTVHTPLFTPFILSWGVIVAYLHLTTVRVPVSKYSILKVKQGKSPYGGLGLKMSVGSRRDELRDMLIFGAFWFTGAILDRVWTFVFIWLALDGIRATGFFAWVWRRIYKKYRRIRKRILYPNLK